MSKAPSAFDLLKSAGKKRTRLSQSAEREADAPRKKQENAHGSSFQPCPVCNKAIASALLAFHVNSCLEGSTGGSNIAQSSAQQHVHQEQHARAASEAVGIERPRQLDSTTPKLPKGHTAEAANAEAPGDPQSASHAGSVRNGEQESNSRLLPEDEHTGASQSQHIIAAADHLGDPQEAHLPADMAAGVRPTQGVTMQNVQENAHGSYGRAEPILQETPAQLEPKEQQAGNIIHAAGRARQPPGSQQGPAKSSLAQPKAAQRSAAPAGNAFAHMMQKQKERAQTWTFYLGRAEDESLFWHMWRDVKGGAPVPEIVTHCSGQGVRIKPPDQATLQRCMQQVVWSAESQASLADLECRVDESVDRAAAGKVTLRLCTNIEPRHGGRLDVGSLLWKSGTAGRPWEYTGTASLLKSALQKNIRRGRAEEAVRCAQRLLQSEPGELLRRACVISVEDALLHPNLPLLAFLMAATAKGYTLGRTLASACLRIVHDLAVVPVQDRAQKGQDYSCSSGKVLQDLPLDEAGASIVRSLLMRAAYGGLQGDVAMLRRFSLLWLARLAGLAGSPSSTMPKKSHSAQTVSSSWPAFLQASFEGARLPGMVLEWGTLGRLKPDDIPFAAVDFHISNVIEDLLGNPSVLAAANAAAAKTGRDPAGLLKSAMWHFSGSCNHRSQLQGQGKNVEEGTEAKLQMLKLLWEATQPAAEVWAHRYIHARFRPA